MRNPFSSIGRLDVMCLRCWGLPAVLVVFWEGCVAREGWISRVSKDGMDARHMKLRMLA